MAIVRAVKSGNWSDTTVWNTGALPTSADDVYSNTYTVTIDVSPTVLRISNATATGVTAGGSFVPTNGITLTCTGAGVVGGTAPCFVSSLSTNQLCTIVAAVTGGSATSAYGVNNSSTGTVNITGNCTGGTGTSSHAVFNASTGIVNITGDCAGANGPTGAQNPMGGVINITGKCVGGAGGPGANNVSTGTISHVGTVQAGSWPGIGTGGSSQVTILSGPFFDKLNWC